jgi:hypothetical protein
VQTAPFGLKRNGTAPFHDEKQHTGKRVTTYSSAPRDFHRAGALAMGVATLPSV